MSKRLFFAVSAVHANTELCRIRHQLQICSAETMAHKEKNVVLFTDTLRQQLHFCGSLLNCLIWRENVFSRLLHDTAL